MSGPEFFQTRMGQQFFDVTMPKIAEQLERVNASLHGIVEALHAHARSTAPESAPAASRASTLASSPRTDAMTGLAQIARDHLRIITLEERKRDALDFYDVGVLSVTAALRAAYELGLASSPSRASR